MRWGHLLCAAFSVAAVHVPAQSLQEAVVQVDDEIDRATRELNAVRDEIAERRRPLVQQLDALRAEVGALRSEARQWRSALAGGDAERASLEREVVGLRDTYRFLEATLREYRRSFETRLPVADAQAVRSELAAIDARPADPSALVATVQAMTDLAEAWNLTKLGGHLQTGSCVDAGGQVLEGSFALLGPLSYFTADGDRVAGWVVSRRGSSRPALLPAPGVAQAREIGDLTRGEEAVVPLDPLGGDGLRVAVARPSLQERLLTGGAVMIPLLLIGVLAAGLTAVKVMAMRNVRAPDENAIDRVTDCLRANDLPGAQAIAGSLSAPFQALVAAGIEYREVRKDHLEEILQERALAMIPRLERHLGLLAVLGGVAPLLGLLGTVTGMMHTFELVTLFGTGDAKLLSGGISEALITTQVGLVIAVPVLLIHAVLSRRVSAITDALEQTLIGFVNRLHAVGGTDA